MSAAEDILVDVHSARQVVPSMARTSICTAIRANLMIMLTGAPGIGKSSIIQDIADEYDMLVIDLRLSQCDPTDLNGFPTFDKDTGKARYAPMDTFPLEGEDIPINPKTGEPYNGWILFLDEMNSADRGVQKASYKLCLDRMVGKFKLHPRVVIVGAGNRLEDNAIVEELSSALQSRMLHLELLSCPPEWLQWAHQAKVDWRVTSYIENQPDQLNRFDPNSSSAEPTYACERTWHFVSRLLDTGLQLDAPETLPLLSATIGEGVARDFINWVAVYKDLPTLHELETNPDNAKLPDSPGKHFAICGLIAGGASVDNIDALATYVDRLPMEFQVVTYRNISLRNRAVLAAPKVAQWLIEHGQELF